MIFQSVKETYWSMAKKYSDSMLERRFGSLRHLVKERLANVDVPDTSAAERDYKNLTSSYSGPGEYGYGDRPNWMRGVDRAKQLVENIPTLRPGSRALEVGCGDGMTAVVLQTFGVDVQLTDLKDWRDSRAMNLSFTGIDLGNASAELPNVAYDLIYSYNAFEHFPDPKTVLTRMLARLKSGGYLFFEFGPLYAGPWGLHAYRMLPMPYPQFLFSESFWRAKLKEGNILDLGQNLDDIQPLNKWTVGQFDTLWQTSGCEILQNRKFQVESFIDLVSDYPGSFQGRGLAYEDLTTQGIYVLLRKPL